MSNKIVEYCRVRPQWADDQFAKWLIEHCPPEKTSPVFMPMQMCINGGTWVQKQFIKRCSILIDDQTAREMFGSIVAIYLTTEIPQQDIFQQIFEGYMRNLPAKA